MPRLLVFILVKLLKKITKLDIPLKLAGILIYAVKTSAFNVINDNIINEG